MEINKQVITGDEARDALVEGYRQLNNAVSPTLGPKGKNAVIYQGEYNSPITTKDGVTVARAFTAEGRFEKIGAQMAKDIAARSNDIAGDGPQPLYAKIATPSGFTTMGELKIGDEICGTNGTTQKVVGVFPKGNREIHDVVFADGRTTQCCEDHLWGVTTYRGTPKVLTAKALMEKGMFRPTAAGNRLFNYYVPTTIVNFDRIDSIPLDPYLLGTLLGDGSLGDSGAIELSLGLKKEHIISKLVLPEGISLNTKYVDKKHYFRVKFKRSSSEGKTMHKIIEPLGLLNTKSATKFIPEAYLYSSLENRKALLQGLLDTDGYINHKGLFEFSTTSYQLKEDLLILARSLGLTVTSHIHTRENDPNSYSTTPIYRLIQLKGYNRGNKLVGITPTGKFTEMQCIKVSNPDHLYITDDLIVTHNTTSSTVLGYGMLANGLAAEKAGAQPVWLKEGMGIAVEHCIKHLNSIAKPIRTEEEVKQVASISANNDDELGAKLAGAVSKVGNNGTVTTEKTEKDTVYVDYSKGYTWKNGFVDEELHPGGSSVKGTAYEDVELIFIDDIVAMPTKPLQEIANAFMEDDKRKPLIFVVKEASGSFLHTVKNWVKTGPFPIGIVQAPGYGEDLSNSLKDMATLCGCEVVRDVTQPMNESHIGSADVISVKKDLTSIYGPKGDKSAVDARVSDLEEELEKSTVDIDREELTVRIAKLSSSIATLFVGAKSSFERDEKLHRIEDALSATRAAIAEGIVAGGGIALLSCSNSLLELERGYTKDVLKGIQVVRKALLAPLETILYNGGYTLKEAKKAIKKAGQDYPIGFDAKAGVACNMIDAGIIDPVRVTKTAIESAYSISGMLLLTSSVIIP